VLLHLCVSTADNQNNEEMHIFPLYNQQVTTPFLEISPNPTPNKINGILAKLIVSIFQLTSFALFAIL
jgi:hypothetical protein